MKRNLLLLAVVWLFSISAIAQTTSVAPLGQGTAESPYLVADLGNLLWIAENQTSWNKYYSQTADIDASETSTWNSGAGWVPIGYDWSNSFGGTYNGNNHTIDGLTINRTGTNYVGLFGYSVSATILNIGITNAVVSGYQYVGALVGRSYYNTISNCYSSGTVTGLYYIGGLLGERGGAIEKCYSNATVTGSQYNGGLVGYYSSGEMKDCYNTGAVNSSSYYSGGLAGLNYGNLYNCYNLGEVKGYNYFGGVVGYTGGSLTNCYNAGSISGNGYSSTGGGLAGYSYGPIQNCYNVGSVSGYYSAAGLVCNNDGTIVNCFSTGSVNTNSDAGGLVCYNYKTVENSFWDTETSGMATSAGGTGKTTAEMQDPSTYIGIGWDYKGTGVTGMWNVGNGRNSDYPYFNWQYPSDPALSIVILPTATTQAIININATTATGQGTFTNIGNPAALSYGVCWNTTGSPTISDSKSELSGPASFGSYTADISGLVPNTTYYVRAFATNANGTRYGNEQSFITNAIEAILPLGAGTEANPYLISNLNNLLWIAKNPSSWNKYFKQTADIDASETSTWNGGEGWTPIASDWNNNFYGTYNGDGFVIDGLTVNRPSLDLAGLFGYTWDAKFINIGITNADITGNEYVGALVAYSGYGTLNNCYSSGNISGNSSVGGLLGYRQGDMQSCYSSADVSGDQNIGGLVGYYYNNMDKCYATGTVTGTSYYTGGLIGRNNGTIQNCYSEGNVLGYYYNGGLIGYNQGNVTSCYSLGNVDGYYYTGGLVGQNYSTILKCFSTGSITGTGSKGGLVGYNGSSVQNSFWNTETSGIGTSSGGIGKTTAEMNNINTFMDAGWGFKTISEEQIWNFGNSRNNNYPYLIWQFPNDPAPSVPVKANIKSINVANISETGAVGIGSIYFGGTPNATAHGVCWNTSGSPTVSDSKTDEGEILATGQFSSTITGLTANTTYYVRAYATNTEGTSYGTQLSFTTLVNGSVSICEAIDNCDLLITSLGSANWGGQTGVTYDGTDAARSGSISQGQSSIMETTVSGIVELNFQWKVSSFQNNNYLRFYIDNVLQQSISGEVDWTAAYYYIGAGTHSLRWEYYKASSTISGSDCGWVDNVSVVPVTCPKPENLSADNVTHNSAELLWNETGSATNWIIEWGEMSFVQGTGTQVSGITSNPYTLTGLAPTTSYSFYVKSDCGSGDESHWVGPYTFTTECAPFDLPLTQNFNGLSSIPNCWKTSGSGSYSANISGYYTNNVLLYSGSNSYAILALPGLSSSVKDVKLSFNASYYYYNSPAKLYVGTMSNSNDASTFTAFEEFDISNGPWSGGHNLSTFFNKYTGTDKYIAFRLGSDDSGNSFRVFIDDISATVTPECPEPTKFIVSSVSSFKASVAWQENGNASSWEIKYGTYGFDPNTQGSIVSSSTQNVELTNLVPETDYQVYVRTKCSDNSQWSSVVGFYTPPTCPQPSDLYVDNITTSSAKLYWEENGSATNWEISYGESGFYVEEGTIVTGISSNPYTLNSLDAGTRYQFYVRSNCGGGDISYWSGPYTFDTECNPFALPLSENFNGSYDLPVCWNSSGYNSYNVYFDYYNYNGTQMNAVLYHSSNSYAMLIMPESNVDLSKIKLSLSALLDYRPSGILYVGTMSDPNDENTFTSYKQFDLTNSPGQPWHDIQVYLNEYTGTDKYIALRFGNSSIGYWSRVFIDNISLEEIPACVTPIELSVSGIGVSSADLQWTQINSAASWNIEWGLAGFVKGTGTFVSGINTDSYNFANLDAGTSYDVYVQADCGSGNSSGWSEKASFTTRVNGDDCSSAIDLSLITSPYNGTTTNAYNDFSFCSMGSSKDLIYTYDVEYGATIEILQSATNFSSRHTMRWGGSCPGTNEISCVDNDDSTPVTWMNTTGSTQRIYFVVAGSGSSQGDFKLDWTYTLPAPCSQPVSLGTTNIDITTADLSWTEEGTASAWNIEWGVKGFELGTGNSVSGLNSNAYSLSSLTSNTEYQFYVQSVCEYNVSTWVGPYTFTTLPRNNPELTWPTASDITYEQPLSDASLSGGAASFDGNSVSGTIEYADASIIPNAGTYAADVKFVPSDASIYNTIYGKVNVNVAKASASIVLSNLVQTYSGVALRPTVTTTPAGLSAEIKYDGTLIMPVNVGTYQVDVTIVNNNYEGSTSDALDILKADLTVTANNLSKKNATDYVFTGKEFTSEGLFASDKVTSISLSSTGAAAAAALGDYSIVPSSAVGTGLTNYNITYTNGTLTVTNMTVLSITGLVVKNKVYNGTDVAEISSWGTLTGVIPGQVVNLVTTNHTALFNDKNVGTAKTVTISDLSLGGADASNYLLASSSIYSTANITAKTVTITPLANQSKTYGDANPIISYTNSEWSNNISFNGQLGRDAGEQIGTYNYNMGTLSLGSNYNLVMVAEPATFKINTKELKIGGTYTIANKVYDGSTYASFSNNSLVLVGVVGNESVSLNPFVAFSDKNVGFNKQVSLTNATTISGADAGNYTLSISNTPTVYASINAKELTIGGTFAATSKVYDGNLNSTISTNGLLLNGVVAPDAVSLIPSVAFADKNVGTTKAVYLTAETKLGGDVANYTLSLAGAPSTTTAITAKELTIGGPFLISDKLFDGSTYASFTSIGLKLNGIVGNEIVTLNPVAAFDNSNIGVSKTVSLTSASTISGSNAGNYALSLTNAPTTTASITKAVEYTLTLTIVGNGKVKVNGTNYTGAISVKEGATLNLEAVADAEWKLSAWSGDITSSILNESVTLYSNKAVTATFTKITGIDGAATPMFTTFPNPFSNSLTVNNADKLSKVTFTNLIGQNVLEVKLKGNAQEVIKTENIDKGVYLIIFQTESGEKIIRKMLKQ